MNRLTSDRYCVVVKLHAQMTYDTEVAVVGAFRSIEAADTRAALIERMANRLLPDRVVEIEVTHMDGGQVPATDILMDLIAKDFG